MMGDYTFFDTHYGWGGVSESGLPKNLESLDGRVSVTERIILRLQTVYMGYELVGAGQRLNR